MDAVTGRCVVYRNHSVAVVVPAYNEAEHVGDVLATMPDFVDRVYAVDDASTDDTWSVIRAHAARTATTADVEPARNADADAVADGGGLVVPIRQPENRGRGACVKLGYRRALDEGYDVIAVMDGDGQMDPALLDDILDPVVEGRADYAKGDRLRYPSTRRAMSGWRTFGNALLTFLTKLSSGYWKTADSQNGYTAVSRETLERVPFEELYDRYGFLNDVLTTLNVHGMRVTSVPHEAVYGTEDSGIRYRSFVPRLSALLARNFVRRLVRRYLVLDFHPAAFCYLLGVVGLVVGLAAAGLATVALDRNALVGVLVSWVGVLLAAGLLVQAMVLDVRQSEELERVDPPAHTE